MSICKFQNANRLIFAAIFTLLLVVGCISTIRAEDKLKFTNDDLQAEIADFLRKWNSAIAIGDEEAIRAAYTDDKRFQWFEDGSLRYRSAAEILKQLKTFPVGTKIDTDLSELRVVKLSESLAYGSAAFKTKIAMPSDDIEFSGVFTMLLERSDTGWRFLSGHTSTAQPQSKVKRN